MNLRMQPFARAASCALVALSLLLCVAARSRTAEAAEGAAAQAEPTSLALAGGDTSRVVPLDTVAVNSQLAREGVSPTPFTSLGPADIRRDYHGQDLPMLLAD